MIVSVIIPVYNKEKYIERSIRSVLNQSFTNFEILVIDDGSTDLSAQIIQNLAKEDSRVKYIFKTNGGVSTARNLGIDKARGEFISFLDADDYWLDNFLEEMINAIKENSIAYCGHYNEINNSARRANMRFKQGNIILNYINNITTPNTNSWLISKRLIENFSIRFEEGVSWGEDMTFFLKVLIHGGFVTTPAKYLTVYVNDAEGHLSFMSIDKIKDDIIWMERAIKYLENNLYDDNLRNKAVAAFRGYRIPASIIYKLTSLLNENKYNKKVKKDLKIVFCKLQNYLQKIYFRNGLRSLKLYLHYFKLKIYFRKD